MHEAVHNLFMKLREKGDLLTIDEYNIKYPKVREECYFNCSAAIDDRNGFVDKGGDISRLFGALCFNLRTQAYPFTRATRTIVVLKKPCLELNLNTQYFTTFDTDSYNRESSFLLIKGEYIPSDATPYKLSEKESMDFVNAIISAGYNDLHPEANIRITSKGVFIIDNEIRNLKRGGLNKDDFLKLRFRFEKYLHAKALNFLDDMNLSH